MIRLAAAVSILFEPGLFTSEPVRTAAVIGGAAALVFGIVGVFTLIRSQSFAGHALADVSSARGAASFLLGINPLLGFLVMGALAACSMELAPLHRAQERDLITGVVLDAGLGLTALFLYWDVTSLSTTGAAITVMFGSMFAIPPSIVLPVLMVGCLVLLTLALLYRPLLLSSLDPEFAAVVGVPVRLVGLVHLIVLALAVALCAITVGAILSTALLIGAAAVALRLARRPAHAVFLAAAFGIAATWGGILLAYHSFYWTAGHGWPVSFPGNELHIVPEVDIPGGNVDYVVSSIRDGKVRDFVGIELQTLDTTGTVWPERQRFLAEHGVDVAAVDVASTKTFSMNWKMTAKTILVQLHHKVQTFEALNKHLVLVVQDRLLDYMAGEFSFDHLSAPRTSDPMHFHSYAFQPILGGHRLQLSRRLSTDTAGVAACLGLQSEARLELDVIYV